MFHTPTLKQLPFTTIHCCDSRKSSHQLLLQKSPNLRKLKVMETWPFAALLLVVFSVSKTESTTVTGQLIMGTEASFGTLETGLLEVNKGGNGGGYLQQDPTASIIVHSGSHVVINGVFTQAPWAKFEYSGTLFNLSSASVIQNTGSSFLMTTTNIVYDLGAYLRLGDMSSLEIGDNTCYGYRNGVCSFTQGVTIGRNSIVNMYDPQLFFFPCDRYHYYNSGCTVNIGSNVRILAPFSYTHVYLFNSGANGGVANIGDNVFLKISKSSTFWAKYSNLTVPTGFSLTLENYSQLLIEEGFPLSSLPQNLIINNSMQYDFYGCTSCSGLFNLEGSNKGNVQMILRTGNSFTAAEGAKFTSICYHVANCWTTCLTDTSGEISMASKSQINFAFGSLTTLQNSSLIMSGESLLNIANTRPYLIYLYGSVRIGDGSKLHTNGGGCISGTIELYGSAYASFDASPYSNAYFSLPGNIFVQDGGSLVAHPSTDSRNAMQYSGAPAPKYFTLSANASLTVSNYALFGHAVYSTFSLGYGTRLTIGFGLPFTMEVGSGFSIADNMNCRTIAPVVVSTGTNMTVEPNNYPSNYFMCF